VSTSSAGRSARGVGTSYAGERLGRPATGPGSVATWQRRVVALCLDWAACTLVAALVTGGASMSSRGAEAWLPMALFLLEGGLLTTLLGGSFGQVATRIAVIHLDGRPVSLLVALLRTALICLVVPPLIYNPDRRGLHDLATTTLTINR
jgi:uncharacterized RDD family membrane protein YckC